MFELIEIFDAWFQTLVSWQIWKQPVLTELTALLKLQRRHVRLLEAFSQEEEEEKKPEKQKD